MENEEITFTRYFQLYSWKEIPHCPGRYVLRKKDNEQLKSISPNELLNNKIKIEIFNSDRCPDKIHIGKFTDGGLLSYQKSDGTFVHTLNNVSGMNITCLEDLSNELLFSIFIYVNPRYLYQTFWNLNSHFNDLLTSIINLQLIIDEEEKAEMITRLASHTGLLQVNTWDEIDLNGFYNLHSLILSRPSSIQLKQIQANTMPKLTHLSLFSNVNFLSPKQLIDDAFSNGFSFLRSARLGYIDFSHVRSCSTQSQSLRYLHIGCSETIIIPFILALCPKLNHLHVDICRDSDKIQITPPILYNHPLQTFILRDYCVSMTYNDILRVLPLIPNTKKIELNFKCNEPFISLLKHLSEFFRYLRRFDCYITEDCVRSSINLSTIHEIHPCFSRIICRTQAKDFQIFATNN